MIEYWKQILTGQFEAALCMLNQCVTACSAEHWEGKIANATFRQVAYHTLFYVDYYLSSGEEAYVLRDFHRAGGDEREPIPCQGLSRDDTLKYLTICRRKVQKTLAAETLESLQGASGFSGLRISRGELHVYNIRHAQHHTGQLSAYLRKVDPAGGDRRTLTWVGSGWNKTGS